MSAFLNFDQSKDKISNTKHGKSLLYVGLRRERALASPTQIFATFSLGGRHKWRHGLRVGGQRFFDGSKKTVIVVKSVTMEGGRLKIVPNCVTSFMDDPLVRFYFKIPWPSKDLFPGEGKIFQEGGKSILTAWKTLKMIPLHKKCLKHTTFPMPPVLAPRCGRPWM